MVEPSQGFKKFFFYYQCEFRGLNLYLMCLNPMFESNIFLMSRLSHLWPVGTSCLDFDSSPEPFVNLQVLSSFQLMGRFPFFQKEWGLPAFTAAHQARDVGASCQRAIHRCHLPRWPRCQGASQRLEWRSQASTAGSGPTHSRCSGNGCRVNEGTES